MKIQEWLLATLKQCEEFDVRNEVNHWYKVNDDLFS